VARRRKWNTAESNDGRKKGGMGDNSILYFLEYPMHFFFGRNYIQK
jgi:hypothetical protein